MVVPVSTGWLVVSERAVPGPAPGPTGTSNEAPTGTGTDRYFERSTDRDRDRDRHRSVGGPGRSPVLGPRQQSLVIASHRDRCCWYTPAGLDGSVWGTPLVDRRTQAMPMVLSAAIKKRGAPDPQRAGVYWQHRPACSAHGTMTPAPCGVVPHRLPEPDTRASGRVLYSAPQPATDIKSYVYPSRTGRVTPVRIGHNQAPRPQPGVTVTVQ